MPGESGGPATAFPKVRYSWCLKFDLLRYVLSTFAKYDQKQLFASVAEGDEKAFAALITAIAPLHEAIVLKIVHSRDHAREILQESFIRIWLHRDKLPALESPDAWFKRVTLNETFTWLNKNASRAKIFRGLAYEPGIAPSAPDNLSFRETLEVLQEAMEQLPPQRKLIFQLSRTHGLKSQEIADRLNLSNGYVKNTLSAALEYIRRKLEDAGKMTILAIIFFIF